MGLKHARPYTPSRGSQELPLSGPSVVTAPPAGHSGNDTETKSHSHSLPQVRGAWVSLLWAPGGHVSHHVAPCLVTFSMTDFELAQRIHEPELEMTSTASIS